MKKTQEATKDFLNSIMAVIAKNSSKNYGMLVFKNMKNRLAKDFPFLSFIKVGDKDIEIDSRINSINIHKIRELFNRIIGILGPNILKLLIRDQLDYEDLKYMGKIGVRF